MAAVVGVPVSVLTTGCGVEIENSINAVLGTNIDDSIEMLESGLLQNARVHVILRTYKDQSYMTSLGKSTIPSKWR